MIKLGATLSEVLIKHIVSQFQGQRDEDEVRRMFGVAGD